jgi:Arc/MetJ family transcription regulator
VETAVTVDADLLDKAMYGADQQNQRQIVEDALRLYVLQMEKYLGLNIYNTEKPESL